MSYPQINTYPLTLGTAGNYAESLKTAKAAFTPRQSVFFMPMAWMRVGNIQYRPEPSLAAFSESTPLFCGILRRLKKMTTLSDTYDAYVKLRQILNNINQKTRRSRTRRRCGLRRYVQFRNRLRLYSNEGKRGQAD